MEHWLWEPVILKSLLEASGEQLEDEAIDTLYQQASAAKADELARQVFYSATEWEMFRTFNNSEGETIMALSHRLAKKHIPHDVPDPKDFGALYRIADANIRDDEPIALYRYIWAEVVAANVFEKAKSTYENSGSLPTDKLVQHLCVPSTREELTSELSVEERRVDALWQRYRLND
jgi:Zn-dependent oligopeptidase